MEKLAIFTAPKPFINPHISLIQQNAIRSWLALGKNVEVWLVGNELGVEEFAHKLGVGYIPNVLRNSVGTPRVDSIFDLVREFSTADYLCYSNADIIFLSDLLSTMKLVVSFRNRFLIVGCRRDMSINDHLNIDFGWEEGFIAKALVDSKLHSAAGSDYFIFPRDEFLNIPEFAVGRAGWDNWMIYQGRCAHLAVIDASNSITAIHQNHDFSHFADGKIHRFQPESNENIILAGGRHTIFSIHDANFSIVENNVQKNKLNRWKIIREFTIFPSIYLKWKGLAKILYYLFNYRLIRRQNNKRKISQK